MNAYSLRGLAAVVLLCIAMPRARADVITFGPLTTATFMDVTIDYSSGSVEIDRFNEAYFWLPGGNYARATHSAGWSADASVYTRGGSMNFISPFPRPNGGYFIADYMAELLFDSGKPRIKENLSFWILPLFSFPGFGSPTAPDYLPVRPIFSFVNGDPLVLRVTWDVSTFVPDSGHTVLMLAAALALVGVAHRFKAIPRCRRSE